MLLSKFYYSRIWSSKNTCILWYIVGGWQSWLAWQGWQLKGQEWSQWIVRQSARVSVLRILRWSQEWVCRIVRVINILIQGASWEYLFLLVQCCRIEIFSFKFHKICVLSFSVVTDGGWGLRPIIYRKLGSPTQGHNCQIRCFWGILPTSMHLTCKRVQQGAQCKSY